MEEKLAALSQKVEGLEVRIEALNLLLGAVLAAGRGDPALLECLKGIAEQQDARGLYSTSLSDDQLHRVQEVLAVYVRELSRKL